MVVTYVMAEHMEITKGYLEQKSKNYLYKEAIIIKRF